MKAGFPVVRDHVQLFKGYGDNLGLVYRKPAGHQYGLLFQQSGRLLIQPSPFNLSLPKPFRHAAHRYHEGDRATREHLDDPANRHFILCDLHHLVMLRGGIALKRRPLAR